MLSSWFFYANWDWRFLGLIVLSTLVDYIAGHKIYNEQSIRIRKAWLLSSIFVNIGILGYFKYADFFIDSLVVLLNDFNVEISKATLEITLPVGISFYTFQSLSYSFDIYRKKLKPAVSLLQFATFVAFFPQLVAGPIVRAKEFLFQLEEKHIWSFDDLEYGAKRFFIGFFKKAIIADNLAIYLVDP